MKILLTGAAGFIGFSTAKALLERGDTVIGFDNFNTYYDATLKEARHAQLQQYPQYQMIRGDLTNVRDVAAAFATLGTGENTRVCHLAAQAGVRHSIDHPSDFIQSNVVGFNNVIEACRHGQVPGLIYASTSSVYGRNVKEPFSEDDRVDSQASLYGVTKRQNELQAQAYHHLYGVKSTGLRFFTVYGPWGRPDMSLFLFTRAILNGQPVRVLGQGQMQRDFTYVDDIVGGVIAAIDRNYPCEIINLGGGKVEELMDYIAIIEKATGKTANKEFLPMQLGDAVRTVSDITKAKKLLDYSPKTHIDTGVPKFVEWYKQYYVE